MASVDPYSPCPCGSGQKFKWCCHKVESYAERAQRMVENGQYEAAIKPLSEGLAKHPDNPWLLTRKALIEVHLKQFDSAKESLRVLLKKEPGHLGGTILMTRLLMESEGPTAAIAQFQQGLSAMAPERRGELAPLASLLGISLCRSGFPIAGFKHLELVQKWGGASDDSSARAIASLRASPALSAWDKNPYHLWPAPEGVGDQFRESFERASAGPMRDSGRPPRRRSSCWPRARPPGRSPIATGVSAASGSPTSTAPSSPCGASSPGPGHPSRRSTSRRSVSGSGRPRSGIASSSST